MIWVLKCDRPRGPRPQGYDRSWVLLPIRSLWPQGPGVPLFPAGPKGDQDTAVGHLPDHDGLASQAPPPLGSAHLPLPQTWGGLQGVLSRPGVHAWARRTAGGVVLVRDPGTPGLVAQCSPRPQGGSTARAAPSWAGAPAGAGPSRGPLARDAPRYRPHPLGTLPAVSTRGFSPEPRGEVGKGQRLTGRQEPGSQGGGGFSPPHPTPVVPRTPGRGGGG